MTEQEANELSICGYGCYVVGGPWIAENPNCPACNHQEELEPDEVRDLQEEVIQLRKDLAEAQEELVMRKEFEVRGECYSCDELQERVRELESSEASFARVCELISEMSWGIDLPSPMRCYMKQSLDPQEPVEEIHAVHPQNYEPVFDAIWRKLKLAPDYQPYTRAIERAEKLEAENKRLREGLERIPTEISMYCDCCYDIKEIAEQTLIDTSNFSE